ncbi:MAG: metalloregulator ArsR/SmtB family transcription factor [Flavobacteriales bacterium]|jgi:DNA-binding transcriptional ArsR family regulator|nr:metalloregulator ArsR/SmtB family transcription factor [Flavobacteriales bacterium]
MKTEQNCIRGCANVSLINRGIEKLEEISNEISQASQIMNLAGNDTRLKILYLVMTEDKICVCDLSDILGISISAISQQLRKLKESNLLRSEKMGQTIYYHINSDSIEIINHIFILLNKSMILKTA